MTISQDLRIRLVQKVAQGSSCRQAAAHFEVSQSSAIRFTHQYETEGKLSDFSAYGSMKEPSTS